MLRFFRIERPTTTTLRPHSTATSAACCMRWMFDANDATRILPRRSGKIARNASPDEPLGARVSGSLGVRRVAEEEVDAAVADLRERADVRLEPVDGRVVELPVPGVHDPSGGGLDDERGGVRDRVRHPHELDAERAELQRLVTGLGRRRAPTSARARARRASTSRARASAASRSRRRPRPPAGGTAARRRGPRARA